MSSLALRPATKLKAQLERLCEVGYLRNPELMRKLEVPGAPAVWEIKVHEGPGYRLYLVQDGRDWLATHGGRKPQHRRVATEVKKTRQKIEAAMQ